MQLPALERKLPKADILFVLVTLLSLHLRKLPYTQKALDQGLLIQRITQSPAFFPLSPVMYLVHFTYFLFVFHSCE